MMNKEVQPIDKRISSILPTTRFVPVRYGDFYIHNFETNEPVRVDDEILTRKDKGEIHRLLVSNLELKAKNMDNIFDSNNIKGSKFGIRRYVWEVPEGEHTHYKELSEF